MLGLWARGVGALLLWGALPFLPSGGRAAAADPGEETAALVLEGIQEARAELRVGRLVRRAVLDEVARQRAREMAARPEGERLSMTRTIEESLREAGVRDFHRARAHVDLQKRYVMQGDREEAPAGGRHDPGEAAAAALERWRNYRTGWAEATDPDLEAIGLGVVEAPDGWLVLVAVLVEDQELPADLATIELQVLRAVNRERERSGLPALSSEPRLVEVARGHSRDMAERGYLQHVSPEGRDLADRLRRGGIAYRRVAENIALNERAKRPGETAVEGWMRSPGHRANILEPAYTHTGVGVARNTDGAFYFTQVFLLPR